MPSDVGGMLFDSVTVANLQMDAAAGLTERLKRRRGSEDSTLPGDRAEKRSTLSLADHGRKASTDRNSGESMLKVLTDGDFFSKLKTEYKIGNPGADADKLAVQSQQLTSGISVVDRFDSGLDDILSPSQSQTVHMLDVQVGDESEQSWFKSMMDGFIEGEEIPVESFGPDQSSRTKLAEDLAAQISKSMCGSEAQRGPSLAESAAKAATAAASTAAASTAAAAQRSRAASTTRAAPAAVKREPSRRAEKPLPKDCNAKQKRRILRNRAAAERTRLGRLDKIAGLEAENALLREKLGEQGGSDDDGGGNIPELQRENEMLTAELRLMKDRVTTLTELLRAKGGR